MQTFLPYEDFAQSALTLDRQRLGKQRVEVLQILQTLRGTAKNGGWKNHPAVKMWRGYEDALIQYGLVVCDVWLSKGYQDTCYEKIAAMRDGNAGNSSIIMPPWVGREDVHASHRANLLRKDAQHYGQFGWTESPDLPYVWPV